MSGDQYDLGRVRPLQVANQIHAIAVWQLEVDQNHLRLLSHQLDTRLFQRTRADSGEALHADQGHQRLARILVVVDDQYVGHAFAPGCQAALL